MCTKLNSTHSCRHLLFRMNGIPAIHPGRTHMKFRSALLLGGVALITAIPVCADSIFYSASPDGPSNPESSAPTLQTTHAKFIMPAGARVTSEPLSEVAPIWSFAMPDAFIAEDSPQGAISGNKTGTFALALDEPQNDARSSDPASATISANGFQPGGAFGSSRSENSMVLSTLVPTEAKPGAHSENLVEFHSSDPITSVFGSDGSRFGVFGRDPNRGRTGKGKIKNNDQDGPPVNVPEPGALPLLAIGLLSVGLIARRNRDFPTSA
jgi:hypothetical protein